MQILKVAFYFFIYAQASFPPKSFTVLGLLARVTFQNLPSLLWLGWRGTRAQGPPALLGGTCIHSHLPWGVVTHRDKEADVPQSPTDTALAKTLRGVNSQCVCWINHCPQGGFGVTAVTRSPLTVCNGRAPHGLLVTYSELSVTLDIVIVSRFPVPMSFSFWGLPLVLTGKLIVRNPDRRLLSRMETSEGLSDLFIQTLLQVLLFLILQPCYDFLFIYSKLVHQCGKQISNSYMRLP